MHYGFRPQVPSLLVENMRIHRAAYGVYHPNYDNHVYRNLLISETDTEPFNRGHDDVSVQYGLLTVDGLTFDGSRNGGMPLIQISDDNPTGAAVSHFRNVKVIDRHDNNKRALVNLGGGPRPTPKTPKGVPVYLHDWYGPGRHAKVVSTAAKDFGKDGLTYRDGGAADRRRVARRRGERTSTFPKLLDPVDDLPPTTVITHVERRGRQGAWSAARPRQRHRDEGAGQRQGSEGAGGQLRGVGGRAGRREGGELKLSGPRRGRGRQRREAAARRGRARMRGEPAMRLRAGRGVLGVVVTAADPSEATFDYRDMQRPWRVRLARSSTGQMALILPLAPMSRRCPSTLPRQ